MRSTIQRQFLLPVLLTVLGAVAISSVLAAWWFAGLVYRNERESLNRIVATLTAPGFPLTESVLHKISGLSGAEYIVVDTNGVVVASTLKPSIAADNALRGLLESPSGKVSEAQAIDLSGEQYLTERVPVVAGDSRHLELVVLSPWGRWQSARWRAMAPPLAVGGCACLALLAVVAVQARRVVRPIRRLREQADAVARGDFRQIPLPERVDEVHDLSVAINTMVARLAAYEEQVRRQERLDMLDRLAGGMSHQLRNAATGARLALELHERDCPLGERVEDLLVARRQLELIETYLQRLLSIGRREQSAVEQPREHVRLAELAQEAVELVTPMCRHARVTLATGALDPLAAAYAHRTDLEQAVINLLMNAIEAVRPLEGRRVVDISVEGGDDRACVRVSDSGPGPSVEISARLFEPFVSDKPDGVGLGLALVRAVAIDHGGTVHWQRMDDRTVFELSLLPAVSEVDRGTVACR